MADILKMGRGVIQVGKFNGLFDFAEKSPSMAFPPKILGMDVLIDSERKPWLIEVERYPGLSAPQQDGISRDIKTSLLMDVSDAMIASLKDINSSWGAQKFLTVF